MSAKPVLRVEINVTTGPVLAEGERAAVTTIVREALARIARDMQRDGLAETSATMAWSYGPGEP